MPDKEFVVVDVWAVQFVPPFVVARIVPWLPTAMQTLVDGQLMPNQDPVLPDVCCAQLDPPFFVPMMLPLLPAA
jgi:hypothetical protein